MTKQRCIAFGCENEKRQGTFVDNLCAPCYEALTTGVAKHGTSVLFKQADEIERLERYVAALEGLTDSQGLKIAQARIADEPEPKP